MRTTPEATPAIIQLPSPIPETTPTTPTDANSGSPQHNPNMAAAAANGPIVDALSFIVEPSPLSCDHEANAKPSPAEQGQGIKW
ncbi:MAG: hypothetical protein ABI894_16565 [Ilumatobacteraceae bacterium]